MTTEPVYSIAVTIERDKCRYDPDDSARAVLTDASGRTWTASAPAWQTWVAVKRVRRLRKRQLKHERKRHTADVQ